MILSTLQRTAVLGLLLFTNQVMADYWRLPNGQIVQTMANSTPPVAGARRVTGNALQQPPQNRAQQPQVQQEPQLAQSFSPQITQQTTGRAVTKVPTKEVLGTGLHSDNCVLFARDRVPSLPHGMNTWAGKKKAINSNTAVKGSVALIPYTDSKGEEIGHAAYVENVDGNTITLLEANFSPGKITRRTATGTDLNEAARQLKIAGFYVPER